MEKITIELELKNDIKNATKNVEKLNEKLDDVDESVKDVGKSTKNLESSTKTLAKGFSGVGLAIKAMGIGLILKGVELLTDAFMRNQKVVDAVSAIFETIAITLNQVTNIIIDNIDKVSKSSKGFEGLTNVIKGSITLALTPLKLAFFSIGLAITEVQLLWEESFFGDKDPKQIKKLTERVTYFKDGIKETGKDAVEAGKKIALNFGKAVGEVSQVVEGSYNGIKKINLEGNYAQAKALVNVRNSAQLAVAQQQGLVEQYDREAELKRQIRDDESKSITERKKANEELGAILEKQRGAMSKLADLQIAAAGAEVKALDNQANRVALQEAINNKKGVEAQITGLMSEQKVNAVALAKEEIELQKSLNEGKNEAINAQEQFNADSIKNDQARLAAQKKALEDQKTRELERLQLVIDTANEGTQAKVDAEKEYLSKKVELENAIKAKDIEIKEEAINREYAQNELILNNEKSTFSARLEALDAEAAIIKAKEFATETERTQALKENTDKRLAIEKLAYEGKRQVLAQTASLLGDFSNMLGQETAEGKALAVAQATINAYLGISEVWKAPNVYPEPFGTATKIASTIAVGTAALQNVDKILSVQVPGGGGGGGSAPSMPSASAPSFNVVGTSGANQIAQTIGQQAQSPIKAYVVSQDVTTQQALDRNIVKSASLG
jgi:hypothetical protein